VPIIPGQRKLFNLRFLIRRKLDLRGNHGLFLQMKKGQPAMIVLLCPDR
jgi:hypothetical protein